MNCTRRHGHYLCLCPSAERIVSLRRRRLTVWVIPVPQNWYSGGRLRINTPDRLSCSLVQRLAGHYRRVWRGERKQWTSLKCSGEMLSCGASDECGAGERERTVGRVLWHLFELCVKWCIQVLGVVFNWSRSLLKINEITREEKFSLTFKQKCFPPRGLSNVILFPPHVWSRCR